MFEDQKGRGTGVDRHLTAVHSHLPCGAEPVPIHLAGGVANGYFLAVVEPKVSACESQQGAPQHGAGLRTDLRDNTPTRVRV